MKAFSSPGVCLIAVLAAGCTFDASQLRALPDGAVEHPAEHPAAADVGATGAGGTASPPDAPAAAGGNGGSAQTGGSGGMGGGSGAGGRSGTLGRDAGLAGAGGGGRDAPTAAGGTGGRDGPTATGGAGITDGPIATGGADARDAPLATGGTSTGGATGGNSTDAGVPDAPGTQADVPMGGSGGGTSGIGGSGGSTGGTTGSTGGTTGPAGTTANGCTACSTGLVCERYPTAACLDPDWAEWPMPNGQVDVTAGAPNLENYTDNGDGTVTDNVTGLMWQQAVPATRYTWASAVAYCPTLTLAGHSDWRLPSYIELVSILDVGESSSNPTMSGTYFPNTPAGYFWTSSPVAPVTSSPWGAWSVYLTNGGTVGTDGNSVSTMLYVRCVR